MGDDGNLVDVAFCSGIHALSNARGKQLVVGDCEGLLGKVQQVVSPFASTMNDDLHGRAGGGGERSYTYIL